VKKSKLSTALLMTVIGGGLAGCSHNCYDRAEGCFSGSSSAATTIATTGKVVDGYVHGATVTLDVNDNGTCDSGEPTTTTDGSGNYSFPVADNQHMVCVTGGTDIGTGLVLIGTLTAPAGATVVTPLTTIVTTAGVANAAAIASRLGLSGVDLLTTDPVAAISTTPALIQTTAAIQTLMVQSASSIQAAGGSGTAAQGNALTNGLYADTVKATGSTLLGLSSPLTTPTLGSIAAAVVTAATTNAQADSGLASLHFRQLHGEARTVSFATQLATLSPASMGNFIGAVIAAMTDAVAAAPASSLNNPGPNNPFALLVSNISAANTVGALATLLLTSANLISATDLQAIANAALPISQNGMPVTASATAILQAISTNATSVTIPPALQTSLTAALNSTNDLNNSVSATFGCDSSCNAVNSTSSSQLAPAGTFAGMTLVNGTKLGTINLTFATPAGNPVVNGSAVGSTDVTGDATAVISTEQTSSVYISVKPNVGDTDMRESLNFRIDGVVFYEDTSGLLEGFIPAGATATVSGALQSGTVVNATLAGSSLDSAISFTHGTSTTPTKVSLDLPALLALLGTANTSGMGMLSALNGAGFNQQYNVTVTVPGLQVQSNIYQQYLPALIANVVWSPPATTAFQQSVTTQLVSDSLTINNNSLSTFTFSLDSYNNLRLPMLQTEGIVVVVIFPDNPLSLTINQSGLITDSITVLDI